MKNLALISFYGRKNNLKSFVCKYKNCGGTLKTLKTLKGLRDIWNQIEDFEMNPTEKLLRLFLIDGATIMKSKENREYVNSLYPETLIPYYCENSKGEIAISDEECDKLSSESGTKAVLWLLNDNYITYDNLFEDITEDEIERQKYKDIKIPTWERPGKIYFDDLNKFYNKVNKIKKENSGLHFSDGRLFKIK